MKLTPFLLLLLPCPLWALFNLGESTVDLSLQGDFSYDSEINARNQGLSDFIGSLGTDLHFSRPSPTLAIRASAGIRFIRYLDNSQFDDENFKFDLSVSPGQRFEGDRFSFSVDLILNSQTRSEETLGEIVNVRTYGLAAELTYRVNQRLTLVGTAGSQLEDPDSDRFDEVQRTNAGIAARFPIRKEMTGELGASYQKTDSDDEIRSEHDTVTVYVGLRDQILSKVTGSLSVGLQQRSFEDREDSTTPYLAGSLEWMINETTSSAIRSNYQTNTTFSDLTTESLDLSVIFRRQLNRDWSANAGIGYTDITYEGLTGEDREDEEYYATASLNWKFSRWGSLSASLRYSDRSSNVDFFQYDRLRTGVGFRARW
ncbi:MAG: outer membrane beta-barrel protein [Verrucomicrobia bacterium]|jgi:hypothetical protein|nr:outer membrane beta-barrel protein [Verrucomicrobiota bacterium]